MPTDQPKTVLLVEDDDDIREAISTALTRCGHRVVSAVHGKDAIARLEELGTAPDLILLDWMMPVMAGSHFVDHLDETGACRGVPIVVLTAVDRVVTLGEIKVTAVIPKPVRLRTLIDVIDRLLGVEKHAVGDVSRRLGQVADVRAGDTVPTALPTADTVAMRRPRGA